MESELTDAAAKATPALVDRLLRDALLKEQGLEGIVDPEELAKPGRVKGVDFLYIGRVTNMRVKAEKTSSNFDLGSLGFGGLFSTSDKKSRITVECGVDIRLVEPSTGEVLASQFGEYKRTDSIGATGVRVLGIGGESKADLKIDEDSRGKILRLALDDAVRKMLAKVDKRLMERQSESQPQVKMCTKCNKEMPADAQECPACKGQ
jgi:curli biogenesis system outer membrane secretion channel CsgG